jgi:transposase
VPVSVGVALVAEDARASDAALRAVLEENRELREDNARLREENRELREDDARWREQQAQQAVELERLRADLAVLQRLLFGRSSERARPLDQLTAILIMASVRYGDGDPTVASGAGFQLAEQGSFRARRGRGG